MIECAKGLADSARIGNLVLFFGAGISVGAGLPGWRDLLQQLAHELEWDEEDIARLGDLDFRDQATVLKSLPGTDIGERVADLLKNPQQRYSLAHGLLASIRAMQAITTNYDDLYEAACKAADIDDKTQQLDVLPYESVSDGGRWLLKLHGTLEHHDSITLTREDYQSLARNHGALLGLVQGMLLTKHMLFVGYSLTDEDFHEVMAEVRLARAKTKAGKELGTQEDKAKAEENEAQIEDKVGTVVTPFEDGIFAKLWDSDLNIRALGGPPASRAKDEIEKRGRVLEIFLDCLALHAADLDRFLLDETYSGMLDDDELQLKQAIGALRDALPESDSLPRWSKVRRLVNDFGGS